MAGSHYAVNLFWPVIDGCDSARRYENSYLYVAVVHCKFAVTCDYSEKPIRIQFFITLVLKVLLSGIF